MPECGKCKLHRRMMGDGPAGRCVHPKAEAYRVNGLSDVCPMIGENLGGVEVPQAIEWDTLLKSGETAAEAVARMVGNGCKPPEIHADLKEQGFVVGLSTLKFYAERFKPAKPKADLPKALLTPAKKPKANKPKPVQVELSATEWEMLSNARDEGDGAVTWIEADPRRAMAFRLVGLGLFSFNERWGNFNRTENGRALLSQHAPVEKPVETVETVTKMPEPDACLRAFLDWMGEEAYGAWEIWQASWKAKP
jgi:hypothetical protein